MLLPETALPKKKLPRRRNNKRIAQFEYEAGSRMLAGFFCEMKIQRIERQKKDKNRYSIFSDNGFVAGVSEDTLARFGLRAGDNIEEERLKEIEVYEDFSTARKDAYSYIAYKPRTKSEVVKKLKAKKHSAPAIDGAIELLTEQKYLDDKVYALSYAAEKLRSKPIGKELLRRKLMQKGVVKETIDSALSEIFPEEEESELAMKALKKYSAKLREDDKAMVRAKCYRHLMSRGFSNDTAYEVTRRFLEEAELGQI